ncbi:putative U3 small nucleolar RNA-associated protein 11 [Sarcoptes scabiei]|nr:putative U3 small nucleolar RNA-associated protein 11 [Sarcoptes scabiei]
MFKMISLIALAVWSMLAMFTFHGELAFGGQLSYDYQLSNPMFHELIGRIENSSPETINQLDDFLSLQKDLIDSENYETDLNILKKNLNIESHQPNELLDRYRFQTRDDVLLPREPVPRKEFLEHSSLYGHQYVQGGAGEGSQHLRPDGSIPNIQVIKSDSVLPAYCNPPNPCPIGYTSEDGCLEEFENSAEFSKEYQSSQECMCDSEHMFSCPGNTDENELETLARSIQNEGLTLDNTLNHLMETMDKNHKVVAKKYFIKRVC